MPTRYTTDYSDPQGARFRGYVECGPMGWVVCIVDLRPTDPIIHQPIKVFGDFVEDPEAGKVMVEARLPWFLKARTPSESATHLGRVRLSKPNLERGLLVIASRRH